MENFRKVYINKSIKCEDCLRTINVFARAYLCEICNAFYICKNCYQQQHRCLVCQTVSSQQVIQRFKGRKVRQIFNLMQMGFDVQIATNSLIRSQWNVDEGLQIALSMQRIEDEKTRRKEQKKSDQMRLQKMNMKKQTHISIQPIKFHSGNKHKHHLPIICSEEDQNDDLDELINEYSQRNYEIISEDNIYEKVINQINVIAQDYDVQLNIACLYYFCHQKEVLKNNKYSHDMFETSEGFCEICCEETTLVGECCGHLYCVNCWNEYLEFNGNHNYQTYCCSHPGCNVFLSLQFILEYCNEKVIEQYKKMLISFFLSQHKEYQRCSGADCNKIIHITHNSSHSQTITPPTKVQCHCGNEFCFQCGREKHNPATCEEIEKWEQLYSSETESLKMITSISKPCFHCGLPTERTKGCNHMTCPRCKGEWCWMCRGDWKTHGTKTGGFYKCTKYENSKAKELDDQAESTKEESERYEYHYERFMNHKVQIRLFWEEVEKKRNIFSKPTTLHELDQLNTICSTIIDGLKILQYSYIKLYFISPIGFDSDLFIYRQHYLEQCIESIIDKVYQFNDSNQLNFLLEESMNCKTVMNNILTL